jgi:hypothetical protein
MAFVRRGNDHHPAVFGYVQHAHGLRRRRRKKPQ